MNNVEIVLYQETDIILIFMLNFLQNDNDMV